MSKIDESVVEQIDILAERLCDDIDARIIAEQENAPSYADSEANVREFWQAIARSALGHDTTERLSRAAQKPEGDDTSAHHSGDAA